MTTPVEVSFAISNQVVPGFQAALQRVQALKDHPTKKGKIVDVKLGNDGAGNPTVIMIVEVEL